MTLDLGVVSSSSTLSVEITEKKKYINLKKKSHMASVITSVLVTKGMILRELHLLFL